MTNPTISQAIATALADGLYHPGNPETNLEPAKLSIPMFRTNVPKPYSDAARTMNQLIGEAVVHLIETMDYTIISNGDLKELREQSNPDR